MKTKMKYSSRLTLALLLTILVTFSFGWKNVKIRASAATNQVVSISNNVLTNQTVTVVGNPNNLYSGNTYSVTSLSDFKDKLDNAISNYADSVTINYNGTTAFPGYGQGLSDIVKSVLQTAGHDYAKTLLSSWQVSYTTPATPGFTATYTFNYLEDANMRSQVASEVTRILGNIITPDMTTDEQKEKAICDYIILNVAYDTSLKDHTAYGALFGNKKTVCQGYALLTYLMLTDAGFNARIVTGTGNGVAHAWNMVMVNGNWYQLDNTWDDPVPDVIGRIRYDYFNLQDSQLKAKGHVWDTITVPAYYPVANTIYAPVDAAIINGGRSVDYKSTAPDSSKMLVTNNLTGTTDSVKVSGLAVNDVIKLYNTSTGGTVIGTAMVAVGKTDVTINIAQLGQVSGIVYATKTSVNQFESDRTAVSYAAEPTTDAPLASNVNITNLTGQADTIKVTGLAAGNIIKVYNVATGGTAVGAATVAVGKTDGTVSIAQLGTAAGSAYITVTVAAKLESPRVEVDYAAEQKTTALQSSVITVANNATGIPDTVKVTGLSAGDVVKVYKDNTSTVSLGTATATATNLTPVCTIAQVGVDAGSVYVTITNSGKLESDRTAASYIAEPVTNAPIADNITITNLAGQADTVKVTGLAVGNIIKVYSAATGGTAIGSAMVQTGKTDGTVSIAQLGAAGGSAYITVTATAKLESPRVEADFIAEQKTTALQSSVVAVTNNATGTQDTVKVTGLSVGDVVKVYKDNTSTTSIAAATATAANLTPLCTIAQLGVDAGSVYVTLTNSGKLESDRTAVSYIAEPVTDAPITDNITITNLAGQADTVKVTGLAVGNLIKVYNAASGGTAIGSTTVQTGKTDGTVSIAQLGAAGGSVYITVTVAAKLESPRVKVDFIAEQTTSSPLTSNITVANYAEISDVITVKGLSAGDIVKVYSATTGGTPIITSKGVSLNKTSISFTITQLGTAAGTVYITVISPGKLESTPRVGVQYDAEP